MLSKLQEWEVFSLTMNVVGPFFQWLAFPCTLLLLIPWSFSSMPTKEGTRRHLSAGKVPSEICNEYPLPHYYFHHFCLEKGRLSMYVSSLPLSIDLCWTLFLHLGKYGRLIWFVRFNGHSAAWKKWELLQWKIEAAAVSMWWWIWRCHASLSVHRSLHHNALSPLKSY